MSGFQAISPLGKILCINMAMRTALSYYRTQVRKTQYDALEPLVSSLQGVKDID